VFLNQDAKKEKAILNAFRLKIEDSAGGVGKTKDLLTAEQIAALCSSI
jgi:hypothetical protein